MKPPTGEHGVLHRGRWANADVVRRDAGGAARVVKDFGGRAWIVRQTLGRFMVRREWRALQRLQGLDGIPARAARVNAFALAYDYVPGRNLRDAPADRLDAAFFRKLEALVRAMHARRVAHLDLRQRTNILLRDDGAPAIVDFQSCLRLDRWPRCARRALESIDLSGVYKHWYTHAPDSLDATRLAHLARIRKWRRLWILQGYRIIRLRARRPYV